MAAKTMTTTVARAEKLVREAMKGEGSSHDSHHDSRVRDLALFLAREGGLSSTPDSMEIVELAALLHDIGDHKHLRDPSEEKLVENFLEEQKIEETKKTNTLRIVKGMDPSSFARVSDPAVMASTTEYAIEKFDGRNSFSLWRVKMKAMLVLQGVHEALQGRSSLPESMSEAEKDDIMEKAHSAIQLSLADEVLRRVAEIPTADQLWLKLEGLYLKKSPTNRLCLKKRLYTLRMEDGTPVARHINKFSEIIMELKDMDVEISDEDQALILLCSSSRSYSHLVDILAYGRDSISVEVVKSFLNLRELQGRIAERENGGHSRGEGPITRGRPVKKRFHVKQ